VTPSKRHERRNMRINCRHLKFSDFDGGRMWQKVYEFFLRNGLPVLNSVLAAMKMVLTSQSHFKRRTLQITPKEMYLVVKEGEIKECQ
jgi:hypothetical protein